MKTLLALTIMFVSANAMAANFRTQDNVNYIIALSDETRPPAAFKACAIKVCTLSKMHGSGQCKIIAKNLGMMVANLTTFGAHQVSRLSCVSAVEVEGEMEALPRLGRSN